MRRCRPIAFTFPFLLLATCGGGAGPSLDFAIHDIRIDADSN